MATGDRYRAKANEMNARAQCGGNPVVRAQLENLALAYLRLASQADINAVTDLVYETPPMHDPSNKPKVAGNDGQ